MLGQYSWVKFGANESPTQNPHSLGTKSEKQKAIMQYGIGFAPAFMSTLLFLAE